MVARPLIIAEAANPEWTSVPLVGWSMAESLLRQTGGHLVTHVRNRDALVRHGMVENVDFTAIDNEVLAKPAWALTDFAMRRLKLGYTFSQVTAALPYLYFEQLVWQRFKKDLRAKKWNVVHRITPLSPTTPSLLPNRLQKLKLPFVLGPLNGGVPWPPGFEGVRNREGDWLSVIRDAYKLMPYFNSTRKYSNAILAGSRFTQQELPQAARERSFLIPENSVDPLRFPTPEPLEFKAPIKAVFLGRLVPYKGGDILLQAAQGVLRSGQLLLDIVGEGPEESKLKQLAKDLGVERAVTFSGWVKHEQLKSHLKGTHLLTFPSIREFGGGVVLEAMALGIVPIVANYAGPAELVTDSTGIRIDFKTKEDLINGFRAALERVVSSPGQLQGMSEAARQRILDHYTWDRKAQQILEVYDFVLGLKPRPSFHFD